MKLYVFDLDGTLSDLTHRLHYIQQPEKNWNKFFEACSGDEPVDWVLDLMAMCKNKGRVLILSGRMETVRSKTQTWLSSFNARYNYLLMRPEGDFTPDAVLKKKMLEDFLIGKSLKVEFIVEDRQRVVDMWRASGYNVLQCGVWEESK